MNFYHQCLPPISGAETKGEWIEAADSGAALIIVNREETPADSRAGVVIHGSVCEAMTRMTA
ncbi:MAG: hypothetical protein ACE14T_10300 [Syntrophales bacterium]